jgi:hypothetical protein
VPDAGFALPSGFAADPTPGLAAVAASGEESWAQLVGAAPAELREWAADGLLVAARLGTGGTPFPGVPSAG